MKSCVGSIPAASILALADLGAANAGCSLFIAPIKDLAAIAP
jgi:hypothetical protein